MRKGGEAKFKIREVENERSRDQRIQVKSMVAALRPMGEVALTPANFLTQTLVWSR